jgi:hypothetical protein
MVTDIRNLKGWTQATFVHVRPRGVELHPEVTKSLRPLGTKAFTRRVIRHHAGGAM